MKCIDQLYPGLKQIPKNNCMPIPAKERYGIRTTIDQGEQTLNKHAKAIDGVRVFAANQDSVLKWALN